MMSLQARTMKMPLFNSPQAAFCTCLPKYNINTYLGRCIHHCIYCYAVKFPSFAGPATPHLKVFDQIEDMAKNTKTKLPVMLSDCTDPYQPLESEVKITRKCADILAGHNFPLLIVTKSNLVVRDMDIFKKTSTVVAITVTTLREDVARIIEPQAPPPQRRIAAVKEMAEQGIWTVARIDPILPTINDDETGFEKLVSTLADAGAKQITVATMKPVKGFFTTLKMKNSKTYDGLVNAYADGKWIMGYKYLDKKRRWEILEKLRPIVLRHCLDFASCREGFSELNTTLCDGTAHLRCLIDNYLT